ncbi:MAG TPA: large conductance mechanosensitive channel protein MscL [Candidatus Aphodousia faecigallinarum]|uniref:Large-conductance mechanosensitive channel n=1 Tax=Candidatus Aphodousia faecigallinarum TaxID=2840677 RepID=A0A9D1IHF2_9BURK|nr:large conductance mechanosensitive channel protein MscL [Candidatus Aphodousia faecigallinarum]
MKQFISDFQSFISRGNVIDMAVGVIVGAAFTAIVNSMVKDVINPILGVLIGSQDFSNFFFVLSMPENYTGPMSYDALTKAGAAVFGYGAFFTAVFHFLLMALVVFSLVRLVNKVRAAAEAKLLAKKEEEKKEAAAAPAPTPADIALLQEIRDLLKQQQANK